MKPDKMRNPTAESKRLYDCDEYAAVLAERDAALLEVRKLRHFLAVARRHVRDACIESWALTVGRPPDVVASERKVRRILIELRQRLGESTPVGGLDEWAQCQWSKPLPKLLPDQAPGTEEFGETPVRAEDLVPPCGGIAVEPTVAKSATAQPEPKPVKRPYPTVDEMQADIDKHTGNPYDPTFGSNEKPEPVKWGVGDKVKFKVRYFDDHPPELLTGVVVMVDVTTKDRYGKSSCPGVILLGDDGEVRWFPNITSDLTRIPLEGDGERPRTEGGYQPQAEAGAPMRIQDLVPPRGDIAVTEG